jgi:hypothetical protein
MRHLVKIDNILNELNMIKRVLNDQGHVINKSELLRSQVIGASNLQSDKFVHPALEIYNRLEEDANRVRKSVRPPF